MKQAKKVTKGMVVDVPAHCFDKGRSGWNGWTFRYGIVTGIAKHKKTGKPYYKVEYPGLGYDNKSKPVVEKWFPHSAVFDAGAMTRATDYLKYKREEFEYGCYSEETEFLIDRGILTEN